MYFLFIIKRRGHEISEVYERHIKNVLTSRFSEDFDNNFETVLKQVNLEALQKPLPLPVKDHDDPFEVDRDELLIYQNRVISDRTYPQLHSEKSTGRLLSPQQNQAT